MHPPDPQTSRPAAVPPPAATPPFDGQITPRALKSFNHIAGVAKGGSFTYNGLYNFAWYRPQAGWKVIVLDPVDRLISIQSGLDSEFLGYSVVPVVSS